ncbi:MAG TPA: FtsQ-type POTRA domain-containing protein [Acidimicrobiales bacterium]|nr:FtsQ-type POTRA domain-containing protein [Acidimicrobiales bacterium]
MSSGDFARIDPRIRQRRVQVRREEGRRRLHVLTASLSAGIVLAAAAGLTRSPLLDLDYVDVRGAERTPREVLLRETGLGGHPLMVEIHTDRIVRRAEALPWVMDATARRQWPGTVRVHVTERVPAAAVPVDSGRLWGLIDVTGRILEVGPAKPAGLPVIGNVGEVGPPGSSIAPAAGASLEVAASLPEALRRRVADVATGPGGEVELQLVAPGGMVRLGPAEGLDQKYAALETLLEKVDLARLAVIDVRVPRAPVLTRR